MSFADMYRSSGTTELGEVPIPELADIAADPQFELLEITQPEFDALWQSGTTDAP